MSLMSDLQIKKEGIINQILEECGAIKDDDITADSVKMKENVNDLSQKKLGELLKRYDGEDVFKDLSDFKREAQKRLDELPEPTDFEEHIKDM